MNRQLVTCMCALIALTLIAALYRMTRGATHV